MRKDKINDLIHLALNDQRVQIDELKIEIHEMENEIRKLKYPPKYKYGDKPTKGFKVLGFEFIKGRFPLTIDHYSYLIDTGNETVYLLESQIEAVIAGKEIK